MRYIESRRVSRDPKARLLILEGLRIFWTYYELGVWRAGIR
jgi:hypothetical protein